MDMGTYCVTVKTIDGEKYSKTVEATDQGQAFGRAVLEKNDTHFVFEDDNHALIYAYDNNVTAVTVAEV